jgi:hypothetical protein
VESSYFTLKDIAEVSEPPVQCPAAKLNWGSKQDALGLEPSYCHQSDMQASLPSLWCKIDEKHL